MKNKEIFKLLLEISEHKSIKDHIQIIRRAFLWEELDKDEEKAYDQLLYLLSENMERQSEIGRDAYKLRKNK